MSRYLLAIDTATARTSVALLDGPHTIVEVNREGVTGHGQALPTLVSEVLQSISTNQLEAIAVGIGPGPFTGLRIGIAFARTMAWALEIKVIGVCTLDALACDYLKDGLARSADFAVATDARRKEVYWAAYDRHGIRKDEPIVVRPSDISASLLRLPTVGSGAHLYSNDFSANVEPIYPSATAIGRLGFAKLDGGEVLTTEPLYLRRPDAMPLISSPELLR
jgi:tRNA threonylcarbamoyladenosine biosynthesis protein TsaB